MEKGEQIGPPGDLDEVLVKYQVKLADGNIVARTPEEGVEFYVKDGHYCPALPKAIKTMKRGEKVNLIVQPHYAFGEGVKDFKEFPSIPPNSELIIDLELAYYKPVINVTGDSKVLKKILKEGEGTLTANEGASVTIRYTALLEDGTVFDRKGFDGCEPLEFITDEEEVIAGLDLAAATMRKGEHALLTIAPEFGFGSIEVKKDLSVVPPSSVVVYNLEMLDFIKEKAPWEMSDQERVEEARSKKDQGNLLFKNGKYQRALKKYEKAADYIGEDGCFGFVDQEQIKSLRLSCWLNEAACSLKLKDFKTAINLCSKVLDIEFYNVKALYRRAQACMETGDLQLAELDIKKPLEADPENREVKLIWKSLKQLQVDSNKRDAKLYTNMFTRMANDSSVATKRMKVDKVEDHKRDEEVMAMEMEKVVVSSAPSENGMSVDSC